MEYQDLYKRMVDYIKNYRYAPTEYSKTIEKLIKFRLNLNGRDSKE